MMPWAGHAFARAAQTEVTLQPSSDALSRCDRLTCVPDNRCPEHRVDVDPTPLSDLLQAFTAQTGERA